MLSDVIAHTVHFFCPHNCVCSTYYGAPHRAVGQSTPSFIILSTEICNLQTNPSQRIPPKTWTVEKVDEGIANRIEQPKSIGDDSDSIGGVRERGDPSLNEA